MKNRKRMRIVALCLLLVTVLALVGCDTPPEQTKMPEETEWTPIYISANPHELDDVGFISYSYEETRYEELRPEQLAMILPGERPYWMKAQGYTAFYWGKLGLDAYYTRINLELSTRLPEYSICLTADVITQEMLDLMGEAKDPYRNIPEHIKDQFFSVCHGVKFLIYEYVNEIYEVSDFVTLEAILRLNNCNCRFTINVPKRDAELLQQVKTDFEQVLECFIRDRQLLDWHGIVPRFSNEYTSKELTFEESWTDGVFGKYMQCIGFWENMTISSIVRSSFYKNDELRVTFTGAEETFQWQFQRSYGYQIQTVKPGEEEEYAAPVYMPEDVTEELLRHRFETHPLTDVGILFEDVLLYIDGSQQHIPWIYQQITRIHDEITQR